ncbi:MAG: DUF2946 family protein [Burkholderiales bacterium]
MFSREATRLSAWAALIAVLFVVLMPAALNASGKSNIFTGLSGFSSICTLEGAKSLLDTPDQPPVVTAHKPCVFCVSSVPVFADANAPHVVAVIEGIPVAVGPTNRAESLPPDVAATQPLSPRAPPRLN